MISKQSILTKLILAALSGLFCLLSPLDPALAQNYQQEPVMNYPSYQREGSQTAPQPNYQQAPQQNYQQAPQQNYQQPPQNYYQQSLQQNFQQTQQNFYQQPYNQNSGHPSYAYSGRQNTMPQTFPQQPVQIYKRAPRMPYQDTGHTNYANPMYEPAMNRAYPRHYQTSNNINYQRQVNPRMNMKRNILRAFFGEGPAAATEGRGGYNANNDPSLAGRASSQKSIALSEADSAESCADRASYGDPSSRRSAAYEARSHANRARSAAEEAQSIADQGNSEAKDYAADAWDAYYRARNAADRAEDSANENVQ